MQWDGDAAARIVRYGSDFFFVLTNTRLRARQCPRHHRGSLPKTLRQAIRALEQVKDFFSSKPIGFDVARHYLAGNGCAIADELGPFDAPFLVPAF
jgi:hypothetical protein